MQDAAREALLTRYRQLKSEAEAGRLDRQSMANILQKEAVPDPNHPGCFWAIHPDTGRWLFHDGTSWNDRGPAASPPQWRGRPQRARMSRDRMGWFPRLVAVLFLTALLNGALWFWSTHQRPAGHRVQATKGTEITMSPNASLPGTAVSLGVVEPSQGLEDDFGRQVADVYMLEIESPEPLRGTLWITIPVDSSAIPPDITPEEKNLLLQPMWREAPDQPWKPLACDFVHFDEKQSSITFPLEGSFLPGVSESARKPRWGVAYASGIWQKITFTATTIFKPPLAYPPTGSCPECPFVIHYYPHNKPVHGIPKSDAWKGSGRKPHRPMIPTSIAQSRSARTPKDPEWHWLANHPNEPLMPDYIEDMFFAASEAYAGLLALKSGSGKAVFQPLSDTLHIYVFDCGVEGGKSDIGGPAAVGCRADDFQHLRQIVAHEMVHVMQGQVYSYKGFLDAAKAGNLWFVEGMAQYLAAEALDLSPEQRIRMYRGTESAEFLSVSLNDSAQGNLYASGQFLDWIDHSVAQGTVSLAYEQSGSLEYDRLTAALNARTGGSLGPVYADFVREIITQPEGFANLNAQRKLNMASYSVTTHLHGGQPRFIYPARPPVMKNTFISVQTIMPPLSSFYLEISAFNASGGLLVIDPTGTASSGLESLTYPFVSARNVDYAQGKALEKSQYSLDRMKPWSLAPFGRNEPRNAFQQAVINASPKASKTLRMRYYVLLKPEIVEVQKSKVTWDTQAVANIPTELIRGYHVFLNDLELTPVPLAHDPGETRQSFQHDAIGQRQPDDDLRVTIEDVYGHTWPGDSSPSTPTGSGTITLEPDHGRPGDVVILRGKGFGKSGYVTMPEFSGWGDQTQVDPSRNFDAMLEVLSWSDTQIRARLYEQNSYISGPIGLILGDFAKGQRITGPRFTIDPPEIEVISHGMVQCGDGVTLKGHGFGNRDDAQLYVILTPDHPRYADGQTWHWHRDGQAVTFSGLPIEQAGFEIQSWSDTEIQLTVGFHIETGSLLISHSKAGASNEFPARVRMDAMPLLRRTNDVEIQFMTYLCRTNGKEETCRCEEFSPIDPMPFGSWRRNVRPTLSWKGQNFSMTYDFTPDDSQQSTVLEVEGTVSHDGNVLERLKAEYTNTTIYKDGVDMEILSLTVEALPLMQACSGFNHCIHAPVLRSMKDNGDASFDTAACFGLRRDQVGNHVTQIKHVRQRSNGDTTLLSKADYSGEHGCGTRLYVTFVERIPSR